MFAPVFRTFVLLGLAAAATAPTMTAASAAESARCRRDTASDHRVCTLPLNKSLVLDLPRDARDILVSNPGIADAVIRTSRRIYLTGIAVGQTNLFVFDADGGTIISLELEIERDITGLQDTIARLIPGSAVVVELVNDNVVLSGSVKSAADARRAEDLANAFANGGANSNEAGADSATTGAAQGAGVSISVGGDMSSEEKNSRIINLISIQGEDQVFLKVTIAEIQRNIAKQLGIDLQGGLDIGGLVTSVLTDNPFGIASKALTSTNLTGTIGDPSSSGLRATMRALEREGVVHTLAEPTLTAISGESANFLAGGEFPVPIGRDRDGNITVEYKPFGVGLTFTPIVLSEGRISIRVKTEVSDLSSEHALELGGVSLPSITVRRAETTLELPSGGSLVLGGLLQDNVRQTISGFPGLKQLPVLGTLFRSRDFVRAETELVIIATPYLVNPVARTELAMPTEGFAPASDASTIFLGHLNRVYRSTESGDPGGANYRGRYGFIFD